MTDPSEDRDPLDALAEEFAARLRAGERPSISEYAARLPGRADAVRNLFPALVELEQLKPDTADRTGEYAPPAGPTDPVRVGEFRILRRVGVGGMGVVYEAVQESLGRHVALKLLPPDAAADPKRLERFRREAKAAARLHHSNIVPVFGTGEAGGRHYYAMQFIAGHPLDAVIDEVKRLRDGAGSDSPSPPEVTAVADALRTGTFHPGLIRPDASSADGAGPVTPADPPTGQSVGGDSALNSSASLSDGGRGYWGSVARVGAQVADALAYAHAQGVVHRDVKPANLLLDLRGTAWVADFGLAKSADADDLTHAGDVIGTLRYMAPERFDGAGDHRADVYALGLTLYELLTLRPAYQAASRARLVELAVAADPPRPRAVDPAVPRDLETVVLKAIRRDPAERYQTAAELADDLRRYQEDRPIRARRATLRELAWRWCRRNPAVAGLLTLVGLLLAGGVVGGAVATANYKAKADEALRAERDADAARRETAVQLWRSQLNAARANTRSGLPGQRFESLEQLKTALAAASESGLTEEDRKHFRDVAAAALALPDLEVVKEWDGFPRDTNFIAVDAALERYARASADGAVCIRRVADDAVLYSLPPTGRKATVALSDSGRVLVVCDDGLPEADRRGRVYSLGGSEPVRIHETAMLYGRNAFVTPDDRRVVFANAGTLNVWDRETRVTDSWDLPGRQLGLGAMSFDGRRVAVPCVKGGGGLLHVHDITTGRTVTDLPFPKSVDACHWHPNGRVVAVGSGTQVHVWDVDAKRALTALNGHRNSGINPIFDHTGDRLLSNDWSNVLRVWDWRAGKQLLNHPSGWFSHARLVSADGRVFTHNQDASKLWVMRLASGSERRLFGPPRSAVGSMRVDPVGRVGVLTAAADSGYGSLVATELGGGGVELGRLAAGRGEFVRQITGDGALLANGYDGLVRWPRAADPATGGVRYGPPQQLLTGFSGETPSASADGRLVVYPTGSSGAVALRTDRVGMSLTLGPHEEVRYTAVSPDGRFAATGSHGTITGVGTKVWDARTGRVVAELATPGGPVSFSPDGRWLATTGGGLRVWRTDTWTEGPVMPDAGKAVIALFSPDGRTVAVGGHGVVRLVRVEDGGELVRLPFIEQAKFVPQCFTPDGGTLYATNEDGKEVIAWDLRLLRAELAELGLDWDEPPLPPSPHAVPPRRVEFVGTDLLTSPVRRVAQQWGDGIAAVLTRPLDADGYIRVGYAAVTGGSPYVARIFLDLALTLDPAREDAHLHRARANLQLRRYDRAAADATAVLDRYPAQLTARHTRAAAYRQLGRPADAIADLSAVLRVDPTSPSTLVERAAAYRAAGDEARAAADLARADAAVGRAIPITINNLAWHLVTGPPRSWNPKRALELMAKIVGGQPNNAVFLNTLGVTQYRNGLYEQAVVSLGKSLAAGKGQADGIDLYFLAMCHHRLGDRDQARDCFDRAVKWHEEHAGSQTPLAAGELTTFRAEAATLLGDR
ncbi:MAG: protein kinase [Gemmataceae bacterium]